MVHRSSTTITGSHFWDSSYVVLDTYGDYLEWTFTLDSSYASLANQGKYVASARFNMPAVAFDARFPVWINGIQIGFAGDTDSPTSGRFNWDANGFEIWQNFSSNSDPTGYYTYTTNLFVVGTNRLRIQAMEYFDRDLTSTNQLCVDFVALEFDQVRTHQSYTNFDSPTTTTPSWFFGHSNPTYDAPIPEPTFLFRSSDAAIGHGTITDLYLDDVRRTSSNTPYLTSPLGLDFDVIAPGATGQASLVGHVPAYHLGVLANAVPTAIAYGAFDGAGANSTASVHGDFPFSPPSPQLSLATFASTPTVWMCPDDNHYCPSAGTFTVTLGNYQPSESGQTITKPSRFAFTFGTPTAATTDQFHEVFFGDSADLAQFNDLFGPPIHPYRFSFDYPLQSQTRPSFDLLFRDTTPITWTITDGQGNSTHGSGAIPSVTYEYPPYQSGYTVTWTTQGRFDIPVISSPWFLPASPSSSIGIATPPTVGFLHFTSKRLANPTYDWLTDQSQFSFHASDFPNWQLKNDRTQAFFLAGFQELIFSPQVQSIYGFLPGHVTPHSVRLLGEALDDNLLDPLQYFWNGCWYPTADDRTNALWINVGRNYPGPSFRGDSLAHYQIGSAIIDDVRFDPAGDPTLAYAYMSDLKVDYVTGKIYALWVADLGPPSFAGSHRITQFAPDGRTITNNYFPTESTNPHEFDPDWSYPRSGGTIVVNNDVIYFNGSTGLSTLFDRVWRIDANTGAGADQHLWRTGTNESIFSWDIVSGGIPALRNRQRDDGLDGNGARKGTGNGPSSAQASVRKGGHTYF